MAQRFDGREVQRRRKALGIGRTRFAADIGRSWESVTGYEAGRQLPPVSVVVRMAERLGCTPGDLFIEDEPTKAATA